METDWDRLQSRLRLISSRAACVMKTLKLMTAKPFMAQCFVPLKRSTSGDSVCYIVASNGQIQKSVGAPVIACCSSNPLWQSATVP